MSPSETQRPISVVYRQLRELVPYARNARRHTAKQIEKIRTLLAHYGWTNPMLIADSEMLAGHGRLRAAIAMAEAGQPIRLNADPWQGPTVDLSYLSAQDRRMYRLADNRVALDAGWDIDALKADMLDMRGLMDGLDMSLTAFDKKELDTLMGVSRSASRKLGNGGALSYQIVIDCTDERHQAAVLAELKAKGLKCRPLIL